jgi:hypothetical protein
MARAVAKEIRAGAGAVRNRCRAAIAVVAELLDDADRVGSRRARRSPVLS